MEKRELTCIGCPLGCSITVTLENGEIKDVTGYTCKRGHDYARKEVTNPTRIVTSTVRLTGSATGAAVVSCKTAQDIPKGKIFDKNFFKGLQKFPRFKSKKRSMSKFYQDNVKIQFNNTHVKFEGFSSSRKRNKQKLNWVRLAEHGRIPTDAKYMNPRISFDGLNWWISVCVEFPDCIEKLNDDGIGIDLGIKDLAICSDGAKYKNINKSQKVKKLEKQKRRLQRSISRSYEKNKKGESYCKTNNVIKKEKLLLKRNHRLTNIRKNYLNQTTSEIVSRKPRFICIEDLNVSGMMKNRHLSKAVQNQGFFEFRKQLEHKCRDKGIQLIVADRFYPSSKLCSCCGNIKKDLKLSDRIYKCDCGNVIDRDFQASINLKAYGERVAS